MNIKKPRSFVEPASFVARMIPNVSYVFKSNISSISKPSAPKYMSYDKTILSSKPEHTDNFLR